MAKSFKTCRRIAKYERCVRHVKDGSRSKAAVAKAHAVCTVAICGGTVRHPGGLGSAGLGGRDTDLTTKEVADAWEHWGGKKTRHWTAAVRELDRHGWRVKLWQGRPASASAIGLTFEVFRPDGSKFPTDGYRLQDLRAAVSEAKSGGQGKARYWLHAADPKSGGMRLVSWTNDKAVAEAWIRRCRRTGKWNRHVEDRELPRQAPPTYPVPPGKR